MEGKGGESGEGGELPSTQYACAYILFDLFISIRSCETKQHTVTRSLTCISLEL